MAVSRTLNPLHFEDLEPHRFEDLIRQLAYGFRPWKTLEATGRLGGDEGVDILGVEAIRASPELVEDDESDEVVSPVVEERAWRFQCKRNKTVRPAMMRTIVEEAVPEGSSSPYGLIVAVACDVSAMTMTAFREELLKRGVAEGHLWTKAHLEDLLFLPENDHLLFAYFGFSLVTRRQSKIRTIQAGLTIKRKIIRALKLTGVTEFKYHDILVRDVEDVSYPHESAIPDFHTMNFPPWHTASFCELTTNGVVLSLFRFRGWLKSDGTWDITPRLRERISQNMDNRRRSGIDRGYNAERMRRDAEDAFYEIVPEGERVLVTKEYLLPYSSIMEIDAWGDPAFEGLHFYCQFNGREGSPYIKSRLTAMTVTSRHVEIDEDKQQPLFKSHSKP